MLLHRVTWVEPQWRRLRAEAPFHPLFVPLDRQGGGRFDNPHRYAALYAATTPQAAVGEVFANSATWLAAEVERPKEGRPRCLVTLEIADDVTLLDLDDPRALSKLGLRPSSVVRRNREQTREVAERIWLQRATTHVDGLRWWSYWRPEWEVAVLWSAGLAAPWFPFANVVDVTALAIDHPAVMLAAEVLPRELE